MRALCAGKGLVHTVCACVKKSWNSETSGHCQDIFAYFQLMGGANYELSWQLLVEAYSELLC